MSKNYFQLLGLDVKYALDKIRLTQNFRQLQSQFHPDKFAHASDMDKRISVQNSALINDAYQTLKDPLKRSIYQLSLCGKELKDNETSMDSSFLMQQMELREKLEVVKHVDEPETLLNEMQAFVNKQISSSITDISNLFLSYSVDNYDDQKKEKLLEQIKTITLKMQFLNKLKLECEDIEDDLL